MAFYFSHESGIKIFLKLFIDNCLKDTRNPILLLFNTLNLKCQEKYFFKKIKLKNLKLKIKKKKKKKS